ncbi:MAG: ATP-binding cassette domain-containing protein [Ruminococcus sp.]|nr:ATP-binding cassette domain-containing protein [Ruminococcus sp.]
MEMVIAFEHTSKYYGNTLAATDVTLSLYNSRIVELIGLNGSGKTTLLKLAAGLIKPDEGSVEIIGSKAGTKTKRLVSFLSDRHFLASDSSALQLMKLYSDFYDDFDKREALESLSDLSIDINKKLVLMSNEMKRKVELALVLARETPIYLLDEPFKELDSAAIDYVKMLIEKKHDASLVVIASGNSSKLENFADDVLWLQNGTVRAYESYKSFVEKAGKGLDEFFREVYKCSES